MYFKLIIGIPTINLKYTKSKSRFPLYKCRFRQKGHDFLMIFFTRKMFLKQICEN